MNKYLNGAYEIIASYAQESSSDHLSDEWSIKAEELYKLQRIMHQLKTVEKKMLEELKDLSHNDTACDGIYTFTKFYRQGSVAYNKITELASIDLNKYRNGDVECWRFGKI